MAIFQRPFPQSQSGIEQPCEFTWSAIPNFKNSLAAFSHDREGRHLGYFRPDHLAGLTAVHARLTFQRRVPGPITIGAGRHCGLGVLVAVEEGARLGRVMADE